MSARVSICNPPGLAGLPQPDPSCRATVVVPARNEEAGLTRTLDALRVQVTLEETRLGWEFYEVILLLNNCTDRSSSVAEQYAADHPGFRLHVADCELPAQRAHVGTARSMLMDCACDRLERLSRSDGSVRGILSTDADTRVAPDWVASNIAELENGAEAVGGVINLFPEELERLEVGTRQAYLRDRAFQAQVARLEATLDPDPADPWPRHLEHFGASLCCTPEIYRRSGGLPAVKPLEDVAFIDALRKKGARIRHSPAVEIFTSARLDGRAEVGLSGQLRHWKRLVDAGLPHLVESAEWLQHRFRTLAGLRRLNEGGDMEAGCFPAGWRERIVELRDASLATPEFLEKLDCDALIEEMFRLRPDKPRRHAEITEVIQRLDALNSAYSVRIG
jgi:hypothetical protein